MVLLVMPVLSTVPPSGKLLVSVIWSEVCQVPIHFLFAPLSVPAVPAVPALPAAAPAVPAVPLLPPLAPPTVEAAPPVVDFPPVEAVVVLAVVPPTAVPPPAPPPPTELLPPLEGLSSSSSEEQAVGNARARRAIELSISIFFMAFLGRVERTCRVRWRE